MKTRPAPSEDPALDRLLQEWNPECSPPPRFEEEVWRRIRVAEGSPAPLTNAAQGLGQWLAAWFARPAFALGYLAVVLVVGGQAGWNHAALSTARTHRDLARLYAQMVDPYQAATQQ